MSGGWIGRERAGRISSDQSPCDRFDLAVGRFRKCEIVFGVIADRRRCTTFLQCRRFRWSMRAQATSKRECATDAVWLMPERQTSSGGSQVDRWADKKSVRRSAFQHGRAVLRLCRSQCGPSSVISVGMLRNSRRVHLGGGSLELVAVSLAKTDFSQRQKHVQCVGGPCTGSGHSTRLRTECSRWDGSR